MGRKTTNNGRNSEAAKLYDIIMSNDSIREVTNKFCTMDDLLDFAEINWADYDDDFIDTVEDILMDDSLLRGFSPRRFIPAMLEWFNDFVYHNGELGLILEDISVLCSKASKTTIKAYKGVTVIYQNITNSYDIDDTKSIAVLAMIHAIRETLDYVTRVGAVETYVAASASTSEEPSEKTEEKKSKEEPKEETKDESTKVEEKKAEKETTCNAGTVDENELKDKIDVESIAQTIYSKFSGKFQEMIMGSIIEEVRQGVDSGAIKSEKEAMDVIAEMAESDVIDTMTDRLSGLKFRNRETIIIEPEDIVEVDESTKTETTEIVPVETEDDSNKTPHVEDLINMDYFNKFTAMMLGY